MVKIRRKKLYPAFLFPFSICFRDGEPKDSNQPELLRLRPAQSDLSPRCTYEESLHPCLRQNYYTLVHFHFHTFEK